MLLNVSLDIVDGMQVTVRLKFLCCIVS